MFRSFYMAGFECATGINSNGDWIDQIACTRHDLHVDEDYRRLREIGVLSAREGVRWPLIDRGGFRYDFSSVDPMLQAAQRQGIELVYDLFHYGYPHETDPFSEEFVERFADYCHETARHIVRNAPGPYY
ncbi:glycoside hydrolase, partial [bacterium]